MIEWRMRVEPGLRLPWMTCMCLALGASWVGSDTSSYTWRLDMGKVMPASSFPQPPPGAADTGGVGQEAVMDILLSTVTASDGTWKKTSRPCQPAAAGQASRGGVSRNNRGVPLDSDAEEDAALAGEVLDCGKPVNFTYYDHLVGLQNRHSHPNMPEPEVAAAFKLAKRPAKASPASTIEAIERKLKRDKRDKPKSLELYNQIGNFWRIKGDTQKSIECFRRALAVSPNNADILLNLARVLFNLQYLEDAIFLTRRSLEVQPPDQNAWLQHFQLGEILKAYSHYQEAALHLRHVLELKPNYGPALLALREMEAIPDSSVHVYTILIIVLLVSAVLVWILITLDGVPAHEEGEVANGSAVPASGRGGRFKKMFHVPRR
eukprot:snap_masked-scaffold1040_size68023-processed-gene-0.10 protein:Tk07637 transcript:snap_masked-scaffold1040_size68023-processed-gene-0.10-mRNA-1 annotation:"tetratricopeptide repeat protein 17"